MDAGQYYITTLTNAAIKIGPLIAFGLVGYFIFVKLPFLFLLRNMKNQKEEFRPERNPVLPGQKYEVKDYERFLNRMKRLEAPAREKKEEPKQQRKEEKKTEKKQEKREEKKEEKKTEAKKTQSDTLSPEAALFEFRPGDVITKEELRKRYHELLRQNHPDKVAALSPDFKKLADKKTKEINSAYSKLKKTAA